MPPIKGGIIIARAGTTQIMPFHDGYRGSWLVRERAQYPDAKVVARCLYYRNDSEPKPCPYCSQADADLGEDPYASLRDEHPSPGDMRKNRAQHVFALWSTDPLQPEEYQRALAEHEERKQAYESTKSFAEKQAMLVQWSQQRMTDPRYPFPNAMIIGLLSDLLADDPDLA